MAAILMGASALLIAVLVARDPLIKSSSRPCSERWLIAGSWPALMLHRAVAGNADVLDALHAPGFLLCTPSGTVWTRQQYPDGLIDGTINYRRFEPVTPIEVVLDTHLAVLRYRSEIAISINSAPLGHLACWHLDVYQHDGVSWRCRWSQATDSIID